MTFNCVSTCKRSDDQLLIIKYSVCVLCVISKVCYQVYFVHLLIRCILAIYVLSQFVCSRTFGRCRYKKDSIL